jgi:Zn-dependent peptidase ImmA (M78 family)
MVNANKKIPSHHDAKKILSWCIERYGKSKYNGNYPAIEYKKPDHTQEDYAGYYDEDEELIFVNKNMVKTMKELTKTIIHEYAHYRYHKMKDYYVLAKYMNHDDNPMEKEAEQIENRDYKLCMSHLEKNRKKV